MTNKKSLTKNIEKEILDIKADENESKDKDIIIPFSKVVILKKVISNIKENVARLENLLAGTLSIEEEEQIKIGQATDENFPSTENNDDANKIIEGVFDGENMIGPDGKKYSVPSNYASKSKLVEGDIMKLTITGSGTFVYKQIGPIERKRIVGKLEKSNDGHFIVVGENSKWRVLTASVTFYKGEANDEVIILVPKVGDSQWAAIENIIKES